MCRFHVSVSVYQPEHKFNKTLCVKNVLQYSTSLLTILCSASQPEVEKQLRLVEYSARYAVGVFLDNGPWNDMDWGMKYFDDPVIRYISINGGHTTPGMQSF